MPVVDLTVDRNLLCPNFDGYKLSFDAMPVLRQDCVRFPLRLEPHMNQFSLLHVEVFAMHNLLFSDPWARNDSYYVNSAHDVVRCSYDFQHGRATPQHVVYSVERRDHGDGASQRIGDYNYSLRFISEKYCVLCDGMNTLYLLDTGNRDRADQWQLVSRTTIDDGSNERGYVLYDARLDVVQEQKQISTVCGHVARQDPSNRSQTYTYIMQLVWGRWAQTTVPTGNPLNAGWEYRICEHLETQGSIYYCAFEPRAESLIICSNRELLTRENRRAMLEAAAEAAAAAVAAAAEAAETAAADANDQNEVHNQNGEQAERTDAYTWSQSDEDVFINFPLRPGAGRNDFNIRCTNHQIRVEYLSETLLDGTLFAEVDNELTTWTVETDCLKMTMMKEAQMHWPNLLANIDAIPEWRRNGYGQNEEPTATESLPIPNLEDPIEECDFPLGMSDAEVKMVRFNLPARSITHTIFLGSTPPLFSTSLRAGFPAAFTTRQGVDAAAWLQVYNPAKPNEWGVRHEGTLHAFGYVQASKEQRKFVDCCPDLDYAVICETIRNVFIYKPRYDTADGLRKRNGPQVVIGKQSLVTLEAGVGEVLGMTTAANVITVLTEHAVLYIQVTS
ncbi:nudC domain-containing protein 1 [Scaptodrosophila lebanonensis]|uniref:NudC domain-containing protein 1 n=1 Tax=Drosophila lebanonensis TaxID=7225 RepID=A0A6J2U3T2_DROLE|nr:nudC domain-containing protein 1 [Scaptodrosophila lebanonensis]